MTIDSTSGLDQFTPTYAQEGTNGLSFTVQASNYSGIATKTINVAVAPQVPSGVSATGTSTSTVQISWPTSPDPNVASYTIIHRTFTHSPKGSGGTYHYTPIATGVTGNSYTVGYSGDFLIEAVNSLGIASGMSAVVSAAVWTPASFPEPSEYLLSVGTVWSGPTPATVVGQTIQITLLGHGNPAADSTRCSTAPALCRSIPVQAWLRIRPGLGTSA